MSLRHPLRPRCGQSLEEPGQRGDIGILVLQREVEGSWVAVADPPLCLPLLSHCLSSFETLRGLRELLPVLSKEACKVEVFDLPLAEEDINGPRL